MIILNDWRSTIGTKLSDTQERIIYDAAFYARSTNFDERSDWSTNYISSISKNLIHVEYDQPTAIITIDGIEYAYHQLESVKLEGKRFLIDVTSLPFPEILYLFDMFNKKQIDFDVLYAQPIDYKRKDQTKLGEVTGFELSDDGLGPTLMPGYVYPSTNSTILVTLGFEGHRYGHLLQSDEVCPQGVVGLVGVPAFSPGWENRSLSNNYESMIDANDLLGASYNVAAANDPHNTYKQIDQIHKAVKIKNHNLHLAPFGTKPSAAAIASFAVNNRDVGVIYDFVRQKRESSNGTDRIHLWRYKYVNK